MRRNNGPATCEDRYPAKVRNGRPSLDERPHCVAISLLDAASLTQQFVLERGDRVQRLLGADLARDGLVDLLLLLGQQWEELRNVPDVLLPLIIVEIGAVVGRPSRIGRIIHDAQHAGLAAALDELLLNRLRQPPFHDVERLFDYVVAVPGGEDEGLSADVRPTAYRAIALTGPRWFSKARLVRDLGQFRVEDRTHHADPVDDGADLALHVEVLNDENVHLPGLGDRRHVFQQA